MREQVRVTQTPPECRNAALSMLFAHLPDQERGEQVREMLRAETRNELSFEGLISAEIEGRTVGAVLSMIQADQCAYVWPPAVAEDVSDPVSVAGALLTELKQHVTSQRAWIAQCLIEPQATTDREMLVHNGFLHLADLDYLTRPLTDPLPPPEKPLETIAFQPRENRERFADMIERTYVGSLDCPELDGIRSGTDAVDSHSATGVFMPEQWTIVRDGGRDVGVLILADHPDQDAWEVVYMGILPESRGRGYGKTMLLDGLYQARDSGRGSVLLAVDSRNGFARRVYDDLGFRLLEVRSVHAMFPTKQLENPQVVHNRDSGR